MSKAISKNDDTIDSRDVEERIDELRELLDGVKEERGESLEALREEREEWLADAGDADDVGDVDIADAGGCPAGFPGQAELDRLEALIDQEWLEEQGYADEVEELAFLEELKDYAEGYCPDWMFGATIINDAYLEDYARELADGICGRGDGVKLDSWPFSCIDWEKAADELKFDYTCVEAGGIDWWVQ